MASEQIHFVTGKLAEYSLRRVLATFSAQAEIEPTVQVLKISVAALMTTKWVASRLQLPAGTQRVILPGTCRGDLEPVARAAGVPVERGPVDLRDLPLYFGRERELTDYGAYDIEILAEINHCPRLPLKEILATAARYAANGADVIDVGCSPGQPWPQVGQTVRALRAEGHRVSIDSYNPVEISAAAEAGAELVLSVNHTNRHAAADWGCEVVAVPDVPADLESLAETLDVLTDAGVPLRIDPILEPIGFGFTASLERYASVRRRWPEAEMMMGIGNLTELTDVDSAGVNVMLLGICQELKIRSVLTTEVINWARSSVRECDLARRLVFHAVKQQTLPKHVEPRLVMLRDVRLHEPTSEELDQLGRDIKDHNFRVFVAGGELHLVSSDLHLQDEDPFALLDQLLELQPANFDAAHAFYLGYELAKATTALTLAKDYRQDQALDWGFLTRPEISRHERLANQGSPQTNRPEDGR